MLKKLRLDQKGRYEQAVAAQYLAEMVVGFVDSREHARSIGREQGGIKEWDDIVVERHDGAYEHVQIKRQDTDFDGSNQVIRGSIGKGKGQGKGQGTLQDLSPLDNAIASLATYFRQRNGVITGPDRLFTLEIPHPQIDIKKIFQSDIS